MPRLAKGPHLHWRERPDGETVWQIRDGSTRISTRTTDRAEAEKQLAVYIDRKHRPTGPTAPTDVSIGQCLTIYGEEHAVDVAAPERIGFAIEALDRYWKDQPVSSITKATCKRYWQTRTTKFGKPAAHGTSRRELNVLQAALNHCLEGGILTSAPSVTLPPKPPAKERWLTRQEAAWLLKGARALRMDGKHLADFILHGLYTGSRKATILAMHIDMPSLSGGHVDTVTGVFYRKPLGKVETTKRQRPARLPPKYLAHLVRQAKRGRRYIVEDYKGRRVGDIKHGWSNALVLAQDLAARKEIEIDLTGVTPHTLKHTAITWTLQKGATIWDTASFFSTSVRTIEEVYGHHSPNHQASAVEALNRRA